MPSRLSLVCDWASYDAAKYACEHWHYSGCVPNQKTVRVGAWENGQFIGVVVFGDGANPGMFKPFGLGYTQGCELVRVALTKHKTPVSRIVRVALLFLRKACPAIRLVVSFADPENGHRGGIYQAGGWIYAGKTAPADEYLVNGKRMHGRALRSTRTTHRLGALPCKNILDWARRVIDPNASPISGSSKHRYLMPMDGEMRRRLVPLSMPYPKRAASIDVDAPGPQPGEGGATPTAALQSQPEAAHG